MSLIATMPIYHSIPPKLTGQFLQPLNRMKESNPELYSEFVEKYRGREFVLKQRVVNLDCLWNDVLHFSPVHPKFTKQALINCGIPTQVTRWFEIEPDAHGFNSSNTSIFLHPVREYGDFTDRAEDFVEYSSDKLSQYTALPQATLKHYEECKRDGKRPLLFCWVPHILHRGQLEISKLQIIEV